LSQDAAALREFAFHDEDFQQLRALVKSLTGINLGEHKRELVYSRLTRRLRALRLRSFAEYRERLGHDEREITELCNAITTNLTAFFREPHHFQYLRDDWLLPLAARGGTRRLRIWSAACSSGEEAYSIAMTVLEALADPTHWDVRILATDLDSEMLERARLGLYPPERIQSLSPSRLQRFFSEHRAGSGAVSRRIAPEVAALVSFKQLNLMRALPMKGPLDAVFCRNVVIYFDRDTQRDLFARIARLQRPGDLLFLGHSESLFKVSESYALIGKSIYRRV